MRNGFKAKTVACPACGSLLDLASKNHEVLSQLEPGRFPPMGHLCVGMRGRVDDLAIEVVGRLRFKGRSYDEEDGEEVWYWDEWLVLNEKGVYHWIAHDEGKYTLYAPFLPEDPPTKSTLDRPRFTCDGESFRVKERDSATIIFIEGEMTWRARIGDAVQYVDAIGANGALSVEWTDDEIEFYRCTPLTPREIFTRFECHKHLAVLDKEHARQTLRGRFMSRWLGSVFILLIGALTAFCCSLSLDVAGNNDIASGRISKLVVHSGEVGDNGTTLNDSDRPDSRSATESKGIVRAVKGTEPREMLFGHPNSLSEPLKWVVELDSAVDAYVLKAEVMMVPPVDRMYFVLISPQGTPHQMFSFQLFEPGWGQANDSVRFSVPTSGKWTLQVGATTAGSPRITAPANYRLVPPPQSHSGLEWKIRDQNVNAAWPCLGSVALLLFMGVYGLLGLIVMIVRGSSGPRYAVVLRTLSVEHHQRVKFGEEGA